MINDLIFCEPEQVGIESKNILKFIERLEERKTNLHSFMMVKDGKIITEAYYKPFNKDFQHRLYSSTKTFVAIAIGMLIEEQKLKLTDKICDVIPDLVQVNLHKWMKDCTIEDALKMSVPMLTDTYFGLDYNEWAWTFFNHPTRSKALKPAGTVFNYNTSGTFILDVVVEKITGKPFLEYMRPVFDKIGVSKDIWCIKSPDGYSWGGSGIVCTLRDFAKFAELLLNKGEYKGEQILPRWFLEKATSKQISNIRDNHFTIRHEYGYGYQIWITKQGFAMLGMGSQFAFCFPDRNFLFVCNGDTQCGSGDTEGDYIYEQLVHEVYDKMADKELAESEDYNKLKEKLSNLELNVGYGMPHSDFEKEIDGVYYDLEENSLGWKWFKFDFNKNNGTFVYENKRGVKKIFFGLNSLQKGTFPETHYYDRQVGVPANREFDCLADLSWTESKKILLRVYVTDTNFGSCFMTFGFKNDEVGLMLNRRAEFFMDDYSGYAGGKKRG